MSHKTSGADKLICVLQARVGSSRLPAKALLPLSGFPSAVLCAKRISNSGLPLLAAIGDEPSADILVRELMQSDIVVFRGSTNNVYKRYLDALKEYHDDTVVVRITADNPFVDGIFVELLIEQFLESGQDYFATRPYFDHLPYGMSAEIFRLGALRSTANTKNSRVIEHVTPSLRLDSKEHFIAYGEYGLFGHLRCTMDTLVDYERLSRVFDLVDNPVAVSWVELCKLLDQLPESPKFGLNYRLRDEWRFTRLALGTAQLGVEAYGACNRIGRMSDKMASEMILCAIDHNVASIDTAYAYGEGLSEKRIGQTLGYLYRDRATVTTKLSPNVPESASLSELQLWTEKSILRSMLNLRTNQLDCVLLHRWSQRKMHEGAIWRTLLELKRRNLIGRLGVSTQNPEETIEAVSDPDISFIQLPINLLDWRWDSDVISAALEPRRDIFVQGRSVFLQGLLLNSRKFWPKIRGFDPSDIIATLDKLAMTFGRKNVADLCIAYVLGMPWVDQIVLGAETTKQIRENVELCQRTPLTGKDIAALKKLLPRAPVELLNPACWS